MLIGSTRTIDTCMRVTRGTIPAIRITAILGHATCYTGHNYIMPLDGPQRQIFGAIGLYGSVMLILYSYSVVLNAYYAHPRIHITVPYSPMYLTSDHEYNSSIRSYYALNTVWQCYIDIVFIDNGI
jgi:hypothetical protein